MKNLVLSLLLLISRAAFAETYTHYFSSIRDEAGNGVGSATVTVYLAGTNTITTIYSNDSGTLKGNPFYSSSVSGHTGDIDFYVVPGKYKIVASKVDVGTFTVDNLQLGTALHHLRHEDGGGDTLDLSNISGTLPDPQNVTVKTNTEETGLASTIDFTDSDTVSWTGSLDSGAIQILGSVKSNSITASHLAENSVGSSELADGAVSNANIAADANIPETKLDLDFATHSNANDPSSGQKAALAGTTGTPSGSNKYVTNSDTRLTDSRTPTAHKTSHENGGSDELNIDQSQVSGLNAGTNLSVDLEEESHHTEHENGGLDELSVSGLSGTLADPQKVTVQNGGDGVGTRSTINFVNGGNADIEVVDNPGDDRIDITIAGLGVPNAEDLPTGCDDGQTIVAASGEMNCGAAAPTEYVATLSTGGGLTGSGSGSASTPTIALSYTDTLAGNPSMAAGEARFGTTGLLFEGSSADTSEGLLTATNPTADRTWTLPDTTGTIALTSDIPAAVTPAGADTYCQFNDSGVFGGDSGCTYNKTTDSLALGGNVSLQTILEFEGNTADSNETTVTVADPTADRTITIPDETGTLALRGDDRTLVKTADETVTASTTPQDDDTFTFPVVSGVTYSFDLTILVSLSTDRGWRGAWTFTGGATTPSMYVGWTTIELENGSIIFTARITDPAELFGPTLGSTGGSITKVEVVGSFTASGTGTMTLQWAQDSDSGSAVELAGSTLEIVKAN